MPSSRPKLLFLCQTLPWPLDAGVHLRTYNVLRLLSERFRLHILCFERAYRPGGQSAAEIADARGKLAELGTVEVFRLPQVHSRVRFVTDHLRSLATRRVFTGPLYENEDFTRRVVEIVGRGDVDLAHVDSLDLAGYLPLLEGVVTVCVHHNVESKLLERRARNERGPLAWYIGLQARLQREEEERWCPRVDLNVAVSEGDRADLLEIAPTAEIAVVPNGVDTDFFPCSPDVGHDGIVFVGGLSWYPNRDAFLYFVREILPSIRERRPDVPVKWVGGGVTERDLDVAREAGVELTGRVDDIRPIVRAARCFVVPLRVGGGSRLKILDAWAMGKPVVSTSVGCEGLGAADGREILVADEPAAFADAVLRVLDDPALASRLGEAARQTAENRFSWQVIGRDMFQLYEGLLAGRS